MPYDPRIHKRRSIRLSGYDYTQPGAYFVTIVTHRRRHLFGEITAGHMRLSDRGRIVDACWRRIPCIYQNVEIDEFTIMPNHIHGIVVISENVGATHWVAPTNAGSHLNSKSIGSIIGQFKSSATKIINSSRCIPTPHVWQRNYFEHIVRNECELSKIREYIRNNPLQWDIDVENR